MSADSIFADRWLIVTGASSGIGRAVSLELVALGARVVLMGRNTERLAETAKLAGAAGRTHIHVLDLAAVDRIGDVIASLVAALGPIYGLCHAAGLGQTIPFRSTRADVTRTQMEINLHAGLELARALTRRDAMPASEGSILWLSSVYAHVGGIGEVAYCATKGAVVAASRAMALELARKGVRVNTLSPGFVSTGMTDAPESRLSTEQWAQIIARHPLGAGTVEDVARAAVFLLDPRNRWITGTDLIIDGGFTA